jgi:hypothetical protein
LRSLHDPRDGDSFQQSQRVDTVGRSARNSPPGTLSVPKHVEQHAEKVKSGLTKDPYLLQNQLLRFSIP